MCKRFYVSIEEKIVGTVEIHKYGLYYQICCRCKLPAEKIYRLQAVCEHGVIDLGICVPFKDGFGVDKRIPVKYLNDENIAFHLTTKRETTDSIFVSLDPQKPFKRMECLMDAKFVKMDGVPGLQVSTNQSPTVR